MEILDKNGLSILWSKIKTKFGNYLPLTGGTLTGSLTVNNASISVNNGDIVGWRYIKAHNIGATGFVGYFNQSMYALKGANTHLIGNNSRGQGNQAIALGQSSWAGVRNQDPDKETYPYLAWQWMNTQPIEVNTTTSSVGGGKFYGYPLLGGEVVEYSTHDGGLFTYENTGQRLQFLLLVKNYDKFVFAGSATSSEPRNVVCYMFGGMYVLRNNITKVTERVIGDTTYYEVIIQEWSTSALDYTKYDFHNQIQLLCATKCNTDNFSGASSYIAGNSALALNYDCRAFGNQSIALGMQSLATSFCSNAIGYNSVSAGSYSFSFGSSSVALGNNSFAFGSSSVAKGYRSAAFGQESITLGNYSMAFGSRSVTKGDYSMAFGYQSTAAATRTMAFGAYSTCTQVDSMNFALYGLSHHKFQTVFGKYNKPEDAALIVGGGNGTDDANRKNIFKVDWNGNVTGKSFSGYSNSVGGEGFKIYPENSNEINFGGTGSTPIIVFGASSKDSRSVPTTYKFGANGDAVLMGGVFTGISNSATMLNTERTLTIGNTGKTFDGTGDVSWSLDEIGVKDENVKFTTSDDNADYRLTAIGQRIAGIVEGTNSVVTADGITMNPSTGAVKAKSFEASKYLQGLVKNSAESRTADVTGQNVFSTYGGGTGTYSNVFGVNSYAGYNNGRTDKPYTYMNMYNTEQIAVNGNSCYAYEVGPSEVVNFTYNGIEYSYSNDSSTLTRVMCVVKGSDIVANHSHNALKRVGFVFNNYKQTLQTSLINWAELIDDANGLYLIVINQFNYTKQNYDFSTVCNIFLATAGKNSDFTGNRANIFGYDSLCESSGIIFGSQNTNSYKSTVFGDYNNVLGPYSYVFGQYNNSGPYSSYSTIFGNYCYCSANYSNLLGVGLINTTAQYQTIIGKYNLPTNDAFMIGWGRSATDRKNIFTIDQSGNVKATSFTGSLKGNADSATKLGSTTIGGSGKPIYLNNGIPTACILTADNIASTMSGYEGNTLGDSINLLLLSTENNADRIDSILTALDGKASTAVVTASTNGLMSSKIYNTKKVSSISVRQGDAASEEIVRNHDIYVAYNEDNAENNLSHKVGGDVPIKIPNATTDYDGSMSYLDKRKLDSFNVDTSTNYYMGNVVRINGDYMLPPSVTIADLRDYAPINGTIADHIELKNGISSGKIPEMIRLSIHNITYMFSLNTIDYTNNQIVYVCPYVQMQFTIDSSTSQFVIEGFNPI